MLDVYLSQRIPLPLVLDRVVDLHGRTLLLAHAVVVEILTCLDEEGMEVGVMAIEHG